MGMLNTLGLQDIMIRLLPKKTAYSLIIIYLAVRMVLLS